jgi:hypothetical protein
MNAGWRCRVFAGAAPTRSAAAPQRRRAHARRARRTAAAAAILAVAVAQDSLLFAMRNAHRGRLEVLRAMRHCDQADRRRDRLD